MKRESTEDACKILAIEEKNKMQLFEYIQAINEKTADVGNEELEEKEVYDKV